MCTFLSTTFSTSPIHFGRFLATKQKHTFAIAIKQFVASLNGHVALHVFVFSSFFLANQKYPLKMFDWCHFLKIGNCSAENVLEIVIHAYIIVIHMLFHFCFSFFPHLFSSFIFTLYLFNSLDVSLSVFFFYFHSQLIDWNQSNWTEHNNSFYCNGYDCASNDLIKQCKAVSLPARVYVY